MTLSLNKYACTGSDYTNYKWRNMSISFTHNNGDILMI